MEIQKKILAVLFGICASTLTLVHAKQWPKLESAGVGCGRPRFIVVESDPGKQRYIPYLITAYRCIGTYYNYTPEARPCVFSDAINRFHTATNVRTGRVDGMKVLVHRSCRVGGCALSTGPCNKFQAWDKPTCKCKCKYLTNPSPNLCPVPKVWRQSKCNCECPTLSTKCPFGEWDKDACACTCKKKQLALCISKGKLANQTTCECFDKAQAKCKCIIKDKWMLAAIAGGEFIVLLLIFHICYQCCCNQSAEKGRRYSSSSSSSSSSQSRY